jgi:putative endonuclease
MVLKNSHNLGQEGEEIAKKYLTDKGYKIVEQNWRFKKYEIDLIATINNQLIIIEVKLRSSIEFGEPEEFVSNKKQHFLIAATAEYLKLKNISLECRFDIISILRLNNTLRVKHLEDAFYPTIK